MNKHRGRHEVLRMECANWDEKKWGITYEEFKRNVERANKDRLWFLNKLDSIREKYAGKWVAVYGNRIISSSEDYDQVVNDVRKKGIKLSAIDIQFVTPEKLWWIL